MKAMILFFVLLPRNIHITTLKYIKNIKSLRPDHRFKPKRRLPGGYKIHLSRASILNYIYINSILWHFNKNGHKVKITCSKSQLNTPPDFAYNQNLLYSIKIHKLFMNSHIYLFYQWVERLYAWKIYAKDSP